ncbi:Maf family protein [Curtobacterium herbarum]|uniref:Nucleoside triphosphate pyrophosphatase n=1 Tax=Curtobacterium herbarum TaxID=150122 RepID=A0ABP4K719_9MICO|nr:Maf family protein [Curtobacterium herbarum]MBM7474970.1 septum formation protein [Curtobacterium herbarum]MCS6545613.1 Maf family protein [Curtobacterium herbarum]
MRLYLASTSPARRALLAQSGIEPVLVAPGVDEDAAAAAERDRLGRELTGPELVSLLAVAKATAVADGLVERTDDAELDGIVLGGDSAFEVDGVLYGKPHDPELARQRWRQMLAAGGGTLWSGHCVVDRRVGAHSVAEATVPGPGGAVRAGDEPPVRPVGASSRPVGASSLGPVAPGGSALVVDGDRVVAVDSAVLTFADDMTPAEIDAYVATGEPLEVAGAFTIDGRAAAFITRIDGAPSAVVGLSLPVLRSMLLQGFGIAWHDLWAQESTPAL